MLQRSQNETEPITYFLDLMADFGPEVPDSGISVGPIYDVKLICCSDYPTYPTGLHSAVGRVLALKYRGTGFYPWP